MVRNRESTAGPSSSQYPPVSRAELPLYEHLKYPLGGEAKLKLSHLVNSAELTGANKIIEQAIKALGDAAATINELSAQRTAKNKAKADGTMVDEEASAYAEDVERMTNRMEIQIRKVIDDKQGIADIKSTLEKLREQNPVTGQSNRRIPSTQASTDATQSFDVTQPGATNPNGVATGPSIIFENELTTRQETYQDLSLSMRYSKHNDYVQFRNLIHDAKHAEDEAPPALPPANTWFRAQGSPVPGTALAADDSDDDIQMMQVKISTKCPLTLKEMANPIRNSQCSHSFDTEAIRSYITTARRGNSKVQCPVPGCSASLGLSDLREDNAFTKKIRRLQEQRKRAMESDDEEEEEDVDAKDGFAEIHTDEESVTD